MVLRSTSSGAGHHPVAVPTPPTLANLWLIGSMGAGKSAVGRVLARRLGRPLVDNDDELEREHGAPTTALAAAGPGSLHEQESAQLRALVERVVTPCVAGFAASVGDRPEDLELLGRTGTVVYLRARVATLVARVGSGRGRPWLEGGAEPYLAAALARRGPRYEAAADVVVDVDDRDAEQVADAILAQLTGSRM